MTLGSIPSQLTQSSQFRLFNREWAIVVRYGQVVPMVTGDANGGILGNEWQIGDFDARSGVSACHDIGIDSKSTDSIESIWVI